MLTLNPTRCCPVWKGILSIAAPFHASLYFSLGNEKVASFWNARCCGDFVLRNQFPNLYICLIDPINKHLSVKNWIQHFALRTNLGFDPSQCLVEQDELLQFNTLIHNILPSDSDDSTIWRWNINGSFSVRNAYDFLSLMESTRDCKIPYLWKLN